MEEKIGKKGERLRRIATAVLTLILIALAVLSFLFRDNFSKEGLRELFGLRSGTEPPGEVFSYETGSDQVFALSGDLLAVASSTGLQLLDGDGSTLAKQVFSLHTPAVAASPVLCAFYDAGGTALRIAKPDGSCLAMDMENAILSVTVSRSGYMAVTTGHPDYKGMVRVYNPSQEGIYEWYSGIGHVLMARVSPDGKTLVTSCVEKEGSVLHFFSLDSEEEQSRWLAEGELVLEFDYLTDGSLVAVTENRLIFLGSESRETAAFDFGGFYLKDYRISGDFATVFLSKYRSGTGGTLVNVGSTGEVLGSLEVRREALSLSSSGKKLLALYSDGLVLYSQKLEELAVYGDTLNVRNALLRADGQALLLFGCSAQLVKLG